MPVQKKRKNRNKNALVLITFLSLIVLFAVLNYHYKASFKSASLIAGGLGLFIFGMKLMSEGLQEIAGEKLRKTLKLLTANRVVGVFTGIAITSIIQSSSATTVMVVGFVNSGIMTLFQSAGVILGANIGTTVTGQLVAFDFGALALPAVAVGSGMYLFGKSDKMKLVGKITLGFGILFFGMNIMASPLKLLRNNPDFRNLFVKFSSNPWLGLLAGTLLTFVVQSSSVTVAITMNLASAGLISFGAAVPIILGDNIGTTITANLASIGTNLAARRAAMVHTLFNLFGSILIMIFLTPYIHFIHKITPGTVPITSEQINSFIKYRYNGNQVEPLVKEGDKYIPYVEENHNQRVVFIKEGENYIPVEKQRLAGYVPHMLRHVANSHTFFNIVNVIFWLPFLGVLTWAASKIYPGKMEVEGEFVKHLDKRMLQSPPIAVGLVHQETLRMYKITQDMTDIMEKLYIQYDSKTMEQLFKKEKIVNMLENAISEYSFLLFDAKLTVEEREIINLCLSSIHEIERIGDHCIQVGESLEYRAKHEIDFSKFADKELSDLFRKVVKILSTGVRIFENTDDSLLTVVQKLEDDIDKLEKKARKRHIKRMNRKLCTPGAGIIFVDILSNLERLADHVHNIARLVGEERINLEDESEENV